jgi:hypothetical protein
MLNKKKVLKKVFHLPVVSENTVRGYTYDASYTYGAHCNASCPSRSEQRDGSNYISVP